MDLLSLITQLLIDISYSWLRMFVALFFSIVIGIAIGIWAARSRAAERIVLPIVDILQTLPILAFFPVVIYLVVAYIPSYIGINAAVILLIITSMLWNIIFGVYESIKMLPNEMLEVAQLYHLSFFQRLRKIFIPASFQEVVGQSILSWSIGLFYLVTSEIFSVGTANDQVKHGIGVALTKLAFSGNFTSYLIGIAIFIIFVIATRLLFFLPLERYVNRYNDSNISRKKTSKRKRGLSDIARVMRFMNTGTHVVSRRFALYRRVNKIEVERNKAVETVRKQAGPWSRAAFYLGLIIMLAVFIYYFGFVNTQYLGYEVEVLVALFVTLVRIWVTLAVILVVALPIGAYIVFQSKHNNAYLTLFQIIASIPATVLLPIIVLSLKNYPAHAEITAFVIFFLSGIWYLIFSLIATGRNLPVEINEVRKLFQVRGWNALKKIYLMGLIPGIITGAVTAVAAEWNASIVAEYFTTTGISSTANSTVVTAVGTGFGKLLDISVASSHPNLGLLVLALINLTVLIVLINTFVWKRLYRDTSKVYR